MGGMGWNEWEGRLGMGWVGIGGARCYGMGWVGWEKMGEDGMGWDGIVGE